MKRLLFAAVVAASLVVAAAATADNDKKDGFKTRGPPMLIGVAPGSTTEAIISVGDMVGGYRFESIPDGIALQRHDNNRVEAFVNHETSLVPFPFPMPPTATTEANAQNDFENAQVSLLTLNRATQGVLDGRLVDHERRELPALLLELPRDQGGRASTVRSCSRTRRASTGSSARASRGRRRSEPPTRARSARSSRTTSAPARLDTIWGMGRHNHENSLAVPGYGHPVVLSGDDSFVNNPAQSQVYSYIADSANDVMNDRGELYAFVSDDAWRRTTTSTSPPAITTSVTGHFEQVPKDIATGRRPDGTDLMAADKGYPLPVSPAPGLGWQRDAVTGIPIDGPQWVLEHWGDDTPRRAGVPVRAHRGHGLRQAAGHGERRLPRRLGREERAGGLAAGTGRRTAASGRWCSTRTTRRRSSRSRSSSKVTTSRSRRRPRSTSRTTSSRRRRAC